VPSGSASAADRVADFEVVERAHRVGEQGDAGADRLQARCPGDVKEPGAVTEDGPGEAFDPGAPARE
jgi:hypothetical protein